MMDIRDRIIVITGGASGIGRGLAERFIRDGANRVVIADISDNVATIAAEIGALGMCLNVAVESEVEDLIARVERDVGPIDLFCSNAGIGIGRDIDESEAVWDRIWHVNTMSQVYAAKYMIPRMVARGGGYLLNTASAAGLLSQIGSVTYAVTKHACVALAEWLSITYGDRGIRVSVLCPQAVRTPMTAGGPGVAGVDGMLETSDVAEAVVQTLREERFLVLPHPEVGEYIKRKTSDYDRWLKGMRRLQEQFVKTP
jgi:NAD(P)-dependent dehydrogenase (short-subunit alcohol dehydrogenase family)